MICGTCKTAGRDKTEHFICPGYINKTWCDCQHLAEGVNWLLVDERGIPKADPRRGA